MVEGERTTEAPNVDRYAFLKYAHLSPAVVEEAKRRGVDVSVIITEAVGILNMHMFENEFTLYHREQYERGKE